MPRLCLPQPGRALWAVVSPVTTETSLGARRHLLTLHSHVLRSLSLHLPASRERFHCSAKATGLASDTVLSRQAPTSPAPHAPWVGPVLSPPAQDPDVPSGTLEGAHAAHLSPTARTGATRLGRPPFRAPTEPRQGQPRRRHPTAPWPPPGGRGFRWTPRGANSTREGHYILAGSVK